MKFEIVRFGRTNAAARTTNNTPSILVRNLSFMKLFLLNLANVSVLKLNNLTHYLNLTILEFWCLCNSLSRGYGFDS